MIAARNVWLSLALCGLACALSSCGARYRVESRTSTNRNDDRSSGGGTTIILVSTATAPSSIEQPPELVSDSTDLRRVTLEEVLGSAKARFPTTDPGLQFSADGSIRASFRIQNTANDPLVNVVIRLLFETSESTYATEHSLRLSPALEPGSSRPLQLTTGLLDGARFDDIRSLHVVALSPRSRTTTGPGE